MEREEVSLSKLFGEYIRSRREKLRKRDPGFSIRQVAKRIGVHHSYLSKVERGEPAVVSEKVIDCLAQALDEDPNLLLAMNGRLSEDVRRTVFDAPNLFSHLIGLVTDPERTENSEMKMSILRGLRDMSIMLLDRDMRIVWARHKDIDSGLEGQKCHEALFGEAESCAGCPTLQNMGSDRFRSGDVTVCSGDIWMVDTSPFFDGTDSLRGFINVAVDVTGSLRAEQAMRQSERLMLHDLKSPLAGIVNLSRILSEDCNLTPEQANGLNVMAKTSEQLLNQVSAALDIRLIESGQRRFVPKDIDVAAVVRDLGKSFLELRLYNGIGLEMTLDGNAMTLADESWAKADENMVSRVMYNLLSNAFEAAGQGETVRIDVSGTVNGVDISIWNSQAVPLEVRDRLFEKYVASGKANGSGLGSYSARIMTECMGGSICCDSTDEIGTTVIVTLPS